MTPEFELAETKLWREVLIRAVIDYVCHPAGIKTDAQRWLMSERSNTGSFIAVCDLLELNHDAVRSKVLSLSASQLKKQIRDDRLAEPDFADRL